MARVGGRLGFAHNALATLRMGSVGELIGLERTGDHSQIHVSRASPRRDATAAHHPRNAALPLGVPQGRCRWYHYCQRTLSVRADLGSTAEYPALAPAVQALGSDIRAVFADAWAKKETEERVQDRYCALEKAGFDGRRTLALTSRLLCRQSSTARGTTSSSMSRSRCVLRFKKHTASGLHADVLVGCRRARRS